VYLKSNLLLTKQVMQMACFFLFFIIHLIINKNCKMRKLHYLLFALVMGLSVSLTSCSDDDDSPIDQTPVIPTVESNSTITEIKAMRVEGEFFTITEDKIIEAVVVSSDVAGNFYKNLMLVEAKKDAPYAAIEVKVNVEDLAAIYPVGQKVMVNCKGLIVNDNYGFANLGGNTYEKDGKTKLGGIAEDVYATTIVKVGEPTSVEPKTVKISEVTNDMLSGLIKIEGVQFNEADKTKTFGADGSYASRTIIDAEGNTIIMKTSGYAKFVEEQLPTGNGSIIGVLNIYRDAYEITIRNTDDVVMTGDRLTIDGDTSGDNGDNGEDDGDNGLILFPGSDFENWDTFTGALNSYGLKDYAVQSDNGREESKAMHISGTPTKNDYVFTATVPENFDATGKTKIIFYIKGTSGKSLSLNLYNSEGYNKFNLGEYSSATTIEPSSSNSYTGAIDTAGEWLKVTLNISELPLQTTQGESLFALKVGKEQAYDLLVDDITIK